ncbi:MAG: energy-coupling factor transporter transmembrane protein EcfT, partial [Planococcaceae bacterium]|nr:energy-coupling factor transporter transmembrane protein EcfT [Planococcaceae bacterium]
MMEKMIFGRYIPGDSFVHKLDPRSKLIFVFIFIAIVFLANNAVTYGLLLGFTLLTVFVSKIRLYFLLNGLKPILFLLVFTFLLHIFFTKEGDLLWKWQFI